MSISGVAQLPVIMTGSINTAPSWDRAFIGSNTNLVAPVEVGEGAMIGAGSTVTRTYLPMVWP